ncbi:sensor histidine kinase [Nocardia sp. CDC159]|uniref:Sensor histidine kinase n=1 Tax=Nocardia pulmonis TaxID=2951408 RepID=A0A9X2EA51_9NOCA|nr:MULTISPECIES: sensor histidine kinase [Nocardia]MCM6777132.1 sensor histidine kinase [Nocardia pulmonis]MCM6790017.1 sensor histidine kinase [Nocardia sp. CDC159]
MTRSFVHPALFYRTDTEYLDGLVPFVTEGDGPVAVAVPPDRLRLLRSALGGAAEHITLIDMSEAGRNPGRIIAGVLREFADAHPDRHVRIVGEPIWAGRSELEYPACAQHEALINFAFVGRDVTIVCPYDTSRLDPVAVADARETHPEVWEGEQRYDSAQYAPAAVVDRYNQPLFEPDAPPVFVAAAPAEVSETRHRAADLALRLGLDPARVPDLELIVTELVTNSLEHADGICLLRLYRHGDHLVCETRDTGHITDPLAGRHPPQPGQFGGRGLLLVHQLADLFRTHTGPGGTAHYALLRLAA